MAACRLNAVSVKTAFVHSVYYLTRPRPSKRHRSDDLLEMQPSRYESVHVLTSLEGRHSTLA